MMGDSAEPAADASPPPPEPGVGRLTSGQWVRRAVLAVVTLAVLSWAWDKSEIDPRLLVENRGRAAEYVFGRPLTEAQEQRLREQAERTVALTIRSEAEDRLRSEAGLDELDPLPAELLARVGETSAAVRDALGDEAFGERVDRTFGRMAQESRGGYFPPETSPEKVRLYVDALLETLAIAIWGTLLAVLTAVPAALLSSSRTLDIILPGERWYLGVTRRAAVFVGRRSFDVCRGFNEFVLALILVAVIGLGPFAGMLALAIHTFGVLGKVFADAMETIHRAEVEGVTSTGASPAQVISYAVIPQVLPYVVSQSLLRFESNVRSATVLGIVGAGGIGFLIDAKLKAYEYREVATIMILVIVIVSLIDFGCGRVMRRLT